MKNLLITCAMLMTFFTADAADNHKIGDTLYVWAPSGLNVRTGPSTHYGKMGKIEIGDYVVVRGITEKKYITNGLPAYENTYGQADGAKEHPYQLRGKWIEVENDEFYGFLVDIYLLKLPYKESMVDCLAHGDMDNVKTDTLLHHSSGYPYEINQTFSSGYSINVIGNSGGGSDLILLPSFTIEEAYVMMNVYSRLEQPQNGPSYKWLVEGTYSDKLYLGDGELCSMTFEMKNGHVLVDFGCYC